MLLDMIVIDRQWKNLTENGRNTLIKVLRISFPQIIIAYYSQYENVRHSRFFCSIFFTQSILSILLPTYTIFSHLLQKYI